ncbi:venom serine carboxypeptidase-like [Venturia canescens]|uniref:venom serine carboxypeptidase-like n=1 Tax=Venturia canescens TaxID=32260 RepID=UPI001C9D0BA2|nr:venom serine carboxypeptidase-like [Venturia canescens]
MWQSGVLWGLALASFVASQSSALDEGSDCPCIAFPKCRKRGERRRECQSGKALYLTPLLEAGHVDEARKKARVNRRLMCNVESYAGYFTVDKTFNSNLFFWYFPAKHDSARAPVVLFLHGGPGVTSLFSLFFLNGPFSIGSEKTCPKLRAESWTNKHNVIYIDNPVGTGYSFTEWEGALPTTEMQIGEELRRAMVQFFQLFPGLRSNDFFAIGESYAGKYVPAVSYAIHLHNGVVEEEKRINLKGMAIANGYTDPVNQLRWAEYLYAGGLLDADGREQFLELEKQARDLILNHQHSAAYEVYDKLIGNGASLFRNLTGYEATANILERNISMRPEVVIKWVDHPYVRRALHVGARQFTPFSEKVYDRLKTNRFQSQAYLVAALLEHYRVLVYTGQLDIFCPYSSVQNYLEKLSWSGAEEFKTAERQLWRAADGDLAGYVKKAGNLSEVLVRKAGQLLFLDQPQWTLELLEKFTHGSL